MNLVFRPIAIEDLTYWIKEDRRVALKIMSLVQDILAHPFTGLGKPEPLQHRYAGCWSRRINEEHRLVYQVRENQIIILQCRHHY